MPQVGQEILELARRRVLLCSFAALFHIHRWADAWTDVWAAVSVWKKWACVCFPR